LLRAVQTFTAGRQEWSGLLVGPIASGKTLLLGKLARACGLPNDLPAPPQSARNLALVSCVSGTSEERLQLLSLSGLNTVRLTDRQRLANFE
jgi:hypothetical protein